MYLGRPEEPTMFFTRTVDWSADVPTIEKFDAPVPDAGDAAPVRVVEEGFGRTNDTALSYESSPPVGNDPPATVHAKAISVAPCTNADASSVADPVRTAALKVPDDAVSRPTFPLAPYPTRYQSPPSVVVSTNVVPSPGTLCTP